ncbi:hypothetical protein PHLCEN_2v6517 [Hermanssonia centrifuga]|uniref:Uncharacterized protein n=1 Tax=Hermanssonia centrifuga TaxID=98765 RepID=A0A2R6NZC2_9APHY|nr:hypothetical protein PHLCEN_2v6517 [Hermanssonia centrifuga]
MSSTVHVQTKYVPPSDPALPALALQITQLVGSYMIWVGSTEHPADKVEIAPLQGSLLRDWACYRNDDNAAGLNVVFVSPPRVSARRFKKQIFLSVDVPPSFMTVGEGARLILAVERAVVDGLKELEDCLSSI